MNFVTNNAQMPLRMVCSCGDATVRLISPGSGQCITTLLIPDMVSVEDVVYAAGESELCLLILLFSSLCYRTNVSLCS